jgi:hypothetical protein
MYACGRPILLATLSFQEAVSLYQSFSVTPGELTDVRGDVAVECGEKSFDTEKACLFKKRILFFLSVAFNKFFFL